jgi:hypothetical protein
MAFSLGRFTPSAANSSSGGLFGLIVRVFLRFLQFVMAITVIGLYGQDLANASKVGKYADSKWVYAVVVASLSALTTLIYFIPLIKSWAFFAWDYVLL